MNLKHLALLLAFLCLAGNSFSQVKGSKLLDSIAKSISTKKNIIVNWETSFMQGKQRVDKTNFAKIKGSEYFHQSGSTTLISDGELVYRSYDDGTVIISHVDTTADYNPIHVLTFFGNGYDVVKLKKYRKTNKIASIRIKTIDKKANLIQEAFLYFDKEGVLNNMKFSTGGKFKNYVKITNMNFSTNLDESWFEIPK